MNINNEDNHINNKDKILILLTSLPRSYKSLVTSLRIGKETLKMEEATKVILNDNKFKKINGNNKSGAFCTDYAYDRSDSCKKKYSSRLSLRPQVKPVDKD